MKTEANGASAPDRGLVYVSTSSIQTDDVAEAVAELSGFTRHIELSGGGRHDPGLLEKLARLKDELGLTYLVHGYFPPPREHFVLNFADTGIKTKGFIDESMKFVRLLDVPYYSVHAGFKRDLTLVNELLFETAAQRTFTAAGIGENIKWFCAAHPGKKLAVENLYPNNNSENCFLMRPEEITSLMDEREQAHLLLDLGHLKISSAFFGFNYIDAIDLLLERYGHRIMEIHLSENDSAQDDHYPVYRGSLQLKAVERYAGIIKDCGINLTIEARNSGSERLIESFELVKAALS